MSSRRLSQAIAEGAGISLLVHIPDPDDAGRAAAQGARGVVVPASVLRADAKATVPVLVVDGTPEAAAAGGADALVLHAERDDADLVALADRATALGVEVVVRVSDEDDLERVLDQLDPEIVLLAPDHDDDEPALEQLLELLPDVPAGKLAIAALADASRADVEELERAGVDAVVVHGDIAALAGDEHPEV